MYIKTGNYHTSTPPSSLSLGLPPLAFTAKKKFPIGLQLSKLDKMKKTTMYRLRISRRLPGGKYKHQYSKEYESVQQLFAQPAFADYLQQNVAGNIYISLHIEKRVVVEEGGAQ